jgi:hypothetical protein
MTQIFKITLIGPTAGTIFPERKTVTCKAETVDRAMDLATRTAGWKIEKVKQYYTGNAKVRAAWREIR